MDLSGLVIEAVERDEEAEFLALSREHHSLGAPHKTGEGAFYAAALKSRARDEWLAPARSQQSTASDRESVADCEARADSESGFADACAAGAPFAIAAITPSAAVTVAATGRLCLDPSCSQKTRAATA